jgi:hypothetical protein
MVEPYLHAPMFYGLVRNNFYLTLELYEACSVETSVVLCETPRCRIPEDNNLQAIPYLYSAQNSFA